MKPHNTDEYFLSGCGRCKLGGTPQCKVHRWSEELALMREIILSTSVSEELKWSTPCYTSEGKNLFILTAFKEYMAINFFKGSLLNDPNNLLTKPGEETQDGRQMRFTETLAIEKHQTEIIRMINETIQIEKDGKKVESKTVNEADYLEELLQILNEQPELKRAFDTLTPGRKRSYLIHFGSAKQSKTRTSRIEKCTPKILKGKGYME
ncbi:MAG: YdeI/OmpD-associated family protein [Bacteroidia bacterium]